MNHSTKGILATVLLGIGALGVGFALNANANADTEPATEVGLSEYNQTFENGIRFDISIVDEDENIEEITATFDSEEEMNAWLDELGIDVPTEMNAWLDEIGN